MHLVRNFVGSSNITFIFVADTMVSFYSEIRCGQIPKKWNKSTFSPKTWPPPIYFVYYQIIIVPQGHSIDLIYSGALFLSESQNALTDPHFLGFVC